MLEKIFGEKNGLVEKALTHPSFTKENRLNNLENYERLEFFGDSVLKLFTSKLLYYAYPNSEEGELSKIRSILVSDAILAKAAVKINLQKYMKLGISEESCGGRNRESNIACTLEAVLGAYYLSGKEAEIEKFIGDYIMIYADDINRHFEKYNAKDILQQYTQGKNKTRPLYRIIDMRGSVHEPEFEVEVEWDGKILARAAGRSKKEAEQSCAFEACKRLGIIDLNR